MPAEDLVAEGINAERVGAWLRDNVAGATPPFRYALITGGHSNLTFRVDDAAGHAYVLRRPPLGTLLATAHDVAREWRIVQALADTPVPVAPALAVCEDAAVNGTPFAITEFVDGVVLRSPLEAEPLDREARQAIAFHLIDVLAELHSVDLDKVGLSTLSRPDSYIERQLKRWSRQWAGSRTRDLPLIDEVEARLQRDIPEQKGVAIVHGDYRLGNCIVDPTARRVAAILDWELCTLGDALADVGYVGIYWHDGPSPSPLTNDPTSAGGFPSYDDLLRRYAARTGRDISGIGYYRAFAAWRLAVIGEGVASRHHARHPEDTVALAASQAGVERLARFALDSLATLGTS